MLKLIHLYQEKNSGDKISNILLQVIKNIQKMNVPSSTRKKKEFFFENIYGKKTL